MFVLAVNPSDVLKWNPRQASRPATMRRCQTPSMNLSTSRLLAFSTKKKGPSGSASLEVAQCGWPRRRFPERPQVVYQTPAMTAAIQRGSGDRNAMWHKDAGGKGDYTRVERGADDWVRPGPRPERDMYGFTEWGDPPTSQNSQISERNSTMESLSGPQGWFQLI